MKKFSLLSVFIILALFLVACAPEDTEPGVGTPGIPDTGDTATPGLGTPDVVITPVETPIVPADTPVVTPPPAETPVVTPGVDVTPVVTPAPGDTGEVDLDDDPNRASNLLDLEVRNMENESLGDIDELIVSISQEQIVYAIIGRGGFLGIGEDLVAVPYDALTLRSDEDGDDFYFVLDVDEETWDNAPEFTFDEINFAVAGWDARFDNTWLGRGQPATPAQPVQPGDSDMVVTIDAVRLTHLLDANVYDMAMVVGRVPAEPATPAQPGQPGTPAAPATPATPAQPGVVTDDDVWVEVGEIEEVVVDAETGDVRYVVVDADEVELDLDDVWIMVPMSALTVTVERDDDGIVEFDADDLRVQVDRDRLANAPSFEAGSLPDTRSPQWDAGVRDYWGTQQDQ